MSTVIKLLHNLNAAFPMVFTLDMFTVTMFEQLKNWPLVMLVAAIWSIPASSRQSDGDEVVHSWGQIASSEVGI